MEKGTHGYLDHKRRSLRMKLLINLLVIAVLFVTGLLLTKTKSNYFTVAAVLMTVPLAYFITGMAAIGKFRSLCDEKMQEFTALTNEMDPKPVTAFELILTVKEKQLYAGAVLFTGAEVMLYTENVKKLYEFRESLSRVLKNTGYFSGVYLTDDWNEFMTRAKAGLEAERMIEKNDPTAYRIKLNELEKQKERLLIYSV